MLSAIQKKKKMGVAPTCRLLLSDFDGRSEGYSYHKACLVCAKKGFEADGSDHPRADEHVNDMVARLVSSSTASAAALPVSRALHPSTPRVPAMGALMSAAGANNRTIDLTDDLETHEDVSHLFTSKKRKLENSSSSSSSSSMGGAVSGAKVSALTKCAGAGATPFPKGAPGFRDQVVDINGIDTLTARAMTEASAPYDALGTDYDDPEMNELNGIVFRQDTSNNDVIKDHLKYCHGCHTQHNDNVTRCVCPHCGRYVFDMCGFPCHENTRGDIVEEFRCCYCIDWLRTWRDVPAKNSTVDAEEYEYDDNDEETA